MPVDPDSGKTDGIKTNTKNGHMAMNVIIGLIMVRRKSGEIKGSMIPDIVRCQWFLTGN